MGALALATLVVTAQQAEVQLPRFRAGANLVRVDAYFTKDGTAITDLKADELEVFEDDKPQKIENVELMAARGGTPPPTTSDPTTVQDMRDAAANSARLFTLFFDTYNTSLSGSYNAQAPVVALLDKVIGPADMVGAMTPDISPGNITYGRRASSIERYVRDTWTWGQRDRVTSTDPRDDEIKNCYPPASNQYAGIAASMIGRRHEQKTLDALDGLITHLDGLRPERKFVVIFTDGWPLYGRDENLARAIGNSVPGVDPVGVGAGGRITTGAKPQDGMSSTFASCERERVMLAYIDHQITLREMAQRANRANVSFYPVDARGLVVFDQDVSVPLNAQLSPSQDAGLLRSKQEALRTLAIQTDGVAVVNITNSAQELQKIFADVGSYYLISYYSSNAKLDGRFRRIGVRVKREGVDVRARQGYLAPTEAEARAAGVVAPRSSGGRLTPMSPPPPAAPVARALDAIAPARGNLPVRVQASGGRGIIRAVVELDVATLKLPEWTGGGDLRLVIEPERGGGTAQTLTAPFDPGQRSVALTGPAAPLDPGRYSVRAEVQPKGTRAGLRVTTFVTIPPATAEIGVGALAMRRGPSTGLAYLPTADPRFRRTERLRIEVPLMGEGFTPTAKMLNREGQDMPLVVTYSTRMDETNNLRLGVAEVVLSALAEGEYVLQVSLEKGGKTEEVTYGFRIVPY